MFPPDPRGTLLRAFDAHAQAFRAEAAQSAEQGARLAGGDVARLTDLAGAVAAGLADWSRRIDRLDVARHRPFDEARAARQILEGVFDESLAPGAWRVLAAAFQLAGSPAHSAAPGAAA